MILHHNVAIGNNVTSYGVVLEHIQGVGGTEIRTKFLEICKI